MLGQGIIYIWWLWSCGQFQLFICVPYPSIIDSSVKIGQACLVYNWTILDDRVFHLEHWLKSLTFAIFFFMLSYFILCFCCIHRDHASFCIRYLKRGVNEKGRVANDVETEQIVFEDTHDGIPTHITSVVQNRGSIPLFWSQETSRLNIKPDIICELYICGNNITLKVGSWELNAYPITFSSPFSAEGQKL